MFNPFAISIVTKIWQGMEETIETQLFSLVPSEIQSVCNYNKFCFTTNNCYLLVGIA